MNLEIYLFARTFFSPYEVPAKITALVAIVDRIRAGRANNGIGKNEISKSSIKKSPY